ncbi:MAG: hypothetical protein BGO96_06115 [Micrococcales bacterium 73-15]|nr:MAG: hypothetical protein BGO96_06115 [Micrococcales bacterium 73-15]
MRLDDGLGDREPQAGRRRRVGVAGAGGLAAGEPVEQRVGELGRDAGAVVADGDEDLAGRRVRRDADADPGPRRRVHARVRGEVDEHLAQPRLIGEDQGQVADVGVGVAVDVVGVGVVTGVAVAGQVELPEVARPGGVRVAHHLGDDGDQVDGRELELAPRVEARKEEQVLDESLHPPALGRDPLDGVPRGVVQVDGSGVGPPARAVAAQHELGVAADRGERGAQLVARVGDERAHLELGGVPRGERALDVPEHPVDRGADHADLGALVGVAGRDALGDLGRTAVQRQLGDALGGGGDAVERTKRAPHDGGRGERGEHDGERADDHLDDDVALERRGRVRPGQRGHGDVARRARVVSAAGRTGRPLGGDGAVAPETRHVDPARLGGGREQRVGLRGRQLDDGAGLVEVAGVDHLTAADLDDDGPGCLAPHREARRDAGAREAVRRRAVALVAGGRVAGGRVVTGRAVARRAGRVGRGERDGRAAGRQHVASAVARGDELGVDPFQQRRAQRERRDQPERERQRERRQHDDGRELGAQAPRWPTTGQGRGHVAGLRTYPAPRRVWIIGSRPASIFRRR